jgi:outer membrane receptor for ferrienterochelin and colicin
MLRIRFPKALAAILALALALITVAPLHAQTTTGTIRGRATANDAAGGVANVQVSARNVATGLVRGAVSDDQGEYTIRLLPPGTYTVTARRLGYGPVEVQDVRIIVGNTTTADIALRSTAAQLAAVAVTARENAIDVAQGGVKQAVTSEEIANLPTLGRDFTDFINLSGLVSPNEGETTGGQFSIAGQRPSQTNLQIDGVDANNAFFGENRGGSRIPFNFSLESVREFNIVTNGYDVEYGNYSGGVVNIVTKGGTNTFRGSAYGNYRGEALTRNDFQGRPPRDFQVQQYALQVEGPFVKDKLFYFFSLDGQRRREPFNPRNAATLRNATGKDADEAAEDSATAVQFDAFLDALDSQYGIANPAGFYDNFETSNDVLTLFGRVDWNINEQHRLAVRNNWNQYENLNEPFSETITTVGGLSQTEAFKNRSNSVTAELNSALGSRAANVLRLQYSTEGRPRIPSEFRPGLEVVLNQSGDLARYGNAGLSFSNNLDEDKFQIVNNFSYDLGGHQLKLGTNNTFTTIDNRFWNNGAGLYRFASVADFAAGTPESYVRALRPSGEPPTAHFSAQEYSFYLQDEWKATPKLLLQAGVRYDVQRYGDRPNRIVDVERAFGYQTGTAPVDDNNISPRAALTYDFGGDGRSVLRAGAGLFYGRVPFVLGSNVAIADVPFLNLDCRGSFANGDPLAPPSVADYADLARNGSDNPTSCLGGGGFTGLPTYSLWSPGFELPETYKANLGYERLLGARTRFSADFVYTASNKLYTVRNINLRTPQFAIAAEGGRQVFVAPSQFTGLGSSAGPGHLLNAEFSDIFVNYNDGASRSQAVTFNLDHRFQNRSSVRASYTWTAANDNTSFSCCTASTGFNDVEVGAFSPNEVGGVGDEARGWGPSNFERRHTVVLSGFTRLPWGIQTSAFMRIQSGTPWGPEVNGDINGDGQRFNDRPFIYSPDELPIAGGDSAVAANRARYRTALNEFDCLRKHVGQIIPRGACRQPWRNNIDVSLRKRFGFGGSSTTSAATAQTGGRTGQGIELSLDLFNVLNGLNADWGKYEAVTAANRNLFVPQNYNPTTQKIEYTVPATFGSRTAIGSNLLLQFSAQLGARYYF